MAIKTTNDTFLKIKRLKKDKIFEGLKTNIYIFVGTKNIFNAYLIFLLKGIFLKE